ncbi:adenylate kinase [Allokutzneria sp. NRRL B-24872]|uniref:adenylate kinase n=1 Tax=Allokutzneria sp. NRRL B-24872 TaxID=1137961 RepID=UPI000A3B8F34|nr:adenylate kinase [Allokutzneria sp. NRRL B-24872]
MRLVLVGPPGAGKGTQATVLSQKLAVPHISTGDLFRANIGESTPLGQEAKRYLDKGELVPDSVTNNMVEDRLAQPDAADGFLLDGFPRNTVQADVLTGLLAVKGTQLDAVLQFDIAEDIVVERLLARGRADDTEEIIRRRQQIYRSETAPLLDYYRGILITIDAVGSVEDISERALKALRAEP